MTRTTARCPRGWRRLLTLSPSTVDFERRGFDTEPAPARATLEAAARAFLDGYHAELASRVSTVPDLAVVPVDRRGFAAEGAAMAATLLDALRPAGPRRSTLLHHAYDARYSYLMHVGAGWALAKLHRRLLGRTGAEAPLLRWLAYDGMGFCAAFFAGRQGLRRWRTHPATCPATCDIRYQGLGRALWFRACGHPATVAAHVASLPERHRDDVWSGVALAASYAGGAEQDAYESLRDVSAGHHPAVAQGAAFAAEAQRLAGHHPPHAAMAVRVLTGGSAGRAAEWTWAARRGLDIPAADATHYRAWRRRVQAAAAAAASSSIAPGSPA